MDNFKLTVVFSDGLVVTEKFVTERGAERAVASWYSLTEEDRKNGETYTIVSADIEPLNVEELV